MSNSESVLLLDTLKASPNGMTTEALESALGWSKDLLTATLNELSQEQRVEFLTLNNSLVFKARLEEESSKLREMNDQERIVYQFIKESGNKGTWIKHIKDKSGLHTKIVTETVQKLEKKLFIKAVKSVKTPTKKVYMLTEFEPSVDLTGGAWYTDQTMDEEFINLLAAQIKRFIDAKTTPPAGTIFPSTFTPPTSVEEIHGWIIKSGLTTQPLSIPDIETLINRLVYDGVVYKSDDDTFRSCINTVGPNALTDAPCGTCPVFSVCSATGKVSPQTCEYLTEWISR